MVPLVSLLGNAGKPPHLEPAKQSGQMWTSGSKDVAAPAPAGPLGQIGSIRNDQMGQPGIAPGFEHMQVPLQATKNVGQSSVGGQGVTRNEIRRDYGPLGQRNVDFVKPVKREEPELEDRDQADDVEEYQEDKDTENDAQQPVKVRTRSK